MDADTTASGERRRPRIAIDGPSGAGKSTLARALAARLGLPYVDTGAMYRAVAWAALRAGAARPEQVVRLLEDTRLEMVTDPHGFRVRVDGEDVTDRLRTPEVGRRASEIAQLPQVRRWLVREQRHAARHGGVLEGRDIGTVVLPDADLKLFVTAPEKVRLARRAAQLGGAPQETVLADVRERDRRDRQRQASPLRPAADAVVVDTGEDTPERSLARILEIARERLGVRERSDGRSFDTGEGNS